MNKKTKTNLHNNLKNENNTDVEFSSDNPTKINDELSRVSTLLRSSEKTLDSIFPNKKNPL
jgi:hypothetical protein